MHFAAVQFEIVWEDKDANHAIIEHMLGAADPPIGPGSYVLLPELGDTGFSFNLDRIVDEKSLDWARRFARSRRIWLQPGFAERGPDGRGRNCAAIIDPDGEVRAIYRKIHPFSYGKEIEHFGGGDELIVRRCEQFNVCPLICYDLRFPELWRLGAIGDTLPGAEVFTIGASWPAARQHHWRSLLIARAIENQAYVVAVNRTGNDPHIKYVGGSIVVSPVGEVLAEAGDEPALLQAELDPEALSTWRKHFPALADVRRELLGSIAAESSLDKNRARPTLPGSAR